MRYDTVKLSVCTDCAMLTANGELGQGDDTADDRHADDMLAQLGTDVRHLVITADEDTSFAWSQCDGCGSRLGGDRFDAVLLIPIDNA